MRAKEYLQQIQLLEDKIDWYVAESERITALLEVKGITYDKDKVQTSVTDKFTEDIVKLIDIDNKCTKLISIYYEKRTEIISQVYELKEQKYRDLLVKVYFERKPLGICAKEMNFSYTHTRHLHVEALEVFEKEYSKYL